MQQIKAPDLASPSLQDLRMSMPGHARCPGRTNCLLSRLSHRSQLFTYKRGGGGGKLDHPVTRGELTHCQPIPSARAGAGKALAPSCQDTLSLSQNTKRALSWPLQHQSHMLLTAPAPLPLERQTLSSQKTNLFLFHQNVVADLADLSWEKWWMGEGNEVTRMGTIQKAT